MIRLLANLIPLVLALASCGCEATHWRMRSDFENIEGKLWASLVLVQGNSMAPAFESGTWLLVDPRVGIEKVKSGDVVASWQPAEAVPVVHRVIFVGLSSVGEPYLVTKGDANWERDRVHTTRENYIGQIRPIL